MRVAVYYRNEDVRLEEMSKPTIGAGEFLVKVMACGICGSDVLEWYRVKRAPLVLGHEATGEIVEVGEGTGPYRVGHRVFVSHHVPCGECRYCLQDHQTACETLHETNYYPGGFAEYLRVPEINVKHGVYLLPKDLSFEAGTFIEPLGCVVRAQRLAQIRENHTVLILGSGISGLLHLRLSRLRGSDLVVTTDVNEYRMNAAKTFGATAVVHGREDVSERLRELNDGRLADRVIVCTGALSASKQALQCVDRGGTVVFFAVPEPSVELPVTVGRLWRDEITLMTSYGAGPKDLQEALELIGSRRISVRDLITHRLSLAEAGHGFKLVSEASKSLKVIVEPQR